MAKTPDTNPAKATLLLQEEERANQELVLFLERDQLAAVTSVPLPRAALSRRVRVGLWALRVFVLLVGVMVIYTFASQLS